MDMTYLRNKPTRFAIRPAAVLVPYVRSTHDDAQFRQRHLKSVCRKPIHSGWIGAQQGNVVAEIPAWPLIEMASANGPVHGRKTRSAARLKLGDFSCFRYA
jgi:hypothetical protein